MFTLNSELISQGKVRKKFVKLKSESFIMLYTNMNCLITLNRMLILKFESSGQV